MTPIFNLWEGEISVVTELKKKHRQAPSISLFMFEQAFKMFYNKVKSSVLLSKYLKSLVTNDIYVAHHKEVL